MGRPVDIMIDDQLLMYTGSDKYVLHAGKSAAGAWWQPLLEKAYAKFHVFYGNISGGWPHEAMWDMTNMPSVQYYTYSQNDKELFDTIHEADRKHWNMSLANFRSAYGLAGGHAYSLMDALKVTDKDGKEWKLIKCRNPWASEGYNGPWSDKDHVRWTDDLREKLGHKKANDGMFLIPHDIFRKVFAQYWVTMYQEWHKSSFMPSRVAMDHNTSFTSSVNQDAMITLSWHSKRKFPTHGCKDKKHNDSRAQRYNVYLTNEG